MLKKLLRYHACWDVTTVNTVMLYSQCIFTKGNIKNLQAFCADKESLEREKYSSGECYYALYLMCKSFTQIFIFNVDYIS